MRTALIICALAAVTLPGSAVFAEQLKADLPSTEELRLLPPYCTTKFTKGASRKDPEVRHWVSILGENYSHIHHYCKGLNYAIRANAGGSNTSHYLKQSLNNYDYVLGHMTPGFVLLPELLVKRGKTLQRQNRNEAAIGDFLKAIKAKPDYTPAYAALSDAYKAMGNKAEARKALEDGLEHKPDSRSLNKRMEKLSGK